MDKKNIFRLMFVTVLIFTFSFVRVTLIQGSYKFFFSGINLVFPALGSLFSVSLSGLFVLLFFLFKKLTLGGVVTLGLPTLVATVVFSTMTKQKEQNSFKIQVYNFILRVILPILAIVLFVVNPVGRDAFIYSFYWLIPIGLYFGEKLKPNDSIFLRSLTTTFLAHAVGSLIWLYFIPTASIYWLSLIPVVFIERLMFALGISLTFKALKYSYDLIVKKVFFKNIGLKHEEII